MSQRLTGGWHIDTGVTVRQSPIREPLPYGGVE